jgi:hypothetical protein
MRTALVVCLQETVIFTMVVDVLKKRHVLLSRKIFNSKTEPYTYVIEVERISQWHVCGLGAVYIVT